MQCSAALISMTTVAALLIGTAIASAQGSQEAKVEASSPSTSLDSGRIMDDDPFRGIVINRTMTVLGWNFYKSFTDIWQSLYPDSESSLTIVERPTAQFGSEIWINYRDRAVFHTFLSPARARLRDISKEAVAVVHDNVNTIDIQRALIQDDDLGPEEL